MLSLLLASSCLANHEILSLTENEDRKEFPNPKNERQTSSALLTKVQSMV